MHLKIFTSPLDYLTTFFDDTNIHTFPNTTDTPNCIEFALLVNDYEKLMKSSSDRIVAFIEEKVKS